MRSAVLAILLAGAGGSAAAEWVGVGRNESNVLYADPATIRRDGDLVKMWNLVDLRIARTDLGGTNYFSQKAEFEYDCNDRQVRLLSYSWHTGKMGGGQTGESNSVPDDWEPILPESGMEFLWRVACAIR